MCQYAERSEKKNHTIFNSVRNHFSNYRVSDISHAIINVLSSKVSTEWKAKGKIKKTNNKTIFAVVKLSAWLAISFIDPILCYIILETGSKHANPFNWHRHTRLASNQQCSCCLSVYQPFSAFTLFYISYFILSFRHKSCRYDHWLMKNASIGFDMKSNTEWNWSKTKIVS